MPVCSWVPAFIFYLYRNQTFMTTDQYIEVNPKIMMGKPVIKKTRVKVEQILENLSVSNAIDEVLRPTRS